MARTKYYLFVDEVKATLPFTVYNFTGVVIKCDLYEQFKAELNRIKDECIPRLGGANMNLHFSPLIGKKKEFSSLTQDEEENLWENLLNLFKNTDYHILSGIVCSVKHKQFYPHYRVTLEVLAFKTLLQNLVRYLSIQNGYAEIITESSTDDDKLIEEFYRTKIAGSKYITSEGYNQLLRGIRFETKDKLNEGLQLVDVMANPVSRLVSGMDQFKTKKIPKNVYFDLLTSKIYDGGVNNPLEFGTRKIFA